MSDPGLVNPAPQLGRMVAHAMEQAAALCARSAELQQQTERLLAEAQTARRITAEARRSRRSSPAGQELLERSEHARLLARLETMPVIEQAKGIIMVQSRCGEAEAFQTLRRASQRANIPVRDLAARLVAKASGTPSPDVPSQPATQSLVRLQACGRRQASRA